MQIAHAFLIRLCRQEAESRLYALEVEISAAEPPAPPASSVTALQSVPFPAHTLPPPPPPPLPIVSPSKSASILSFPSVGSQNTVTAASTEVLEQQAARWRVVVQEVRERHATVIAAMERRIASALEAEKEARTLTEELMQALLDARIRMVVAGVPIEDLPEFVSASQ